MAEMQSRYAGKGNPFNEILYAKKMYENENATEGQKKWAHKHAQQYYGMLNDAQAEKLQGMNYDTANNYRDYLMGQESAGTDRVNDIYDNIRDARFSQLEASRNKAIGQINQTKAEVKPMYANKRNQTDVVNHQNVQKLREIMASQGLTGSGENVTAMVGANAQRQGSLNALNLQEQQTINDLNRRITDINDPAREQAILSELAAERARALYGSFQEDRNFNYQKGRDAVMDNRWEDEFNWSQNRWKSEFDEGKRRFDSEQEWREYTYNNMSASEKAQLEWAKSRFGEEMAWQMFDAEQNRAYEQAYNQAMIDAMQGNFNSGGGGGWNAKQTAWMPSISSGDFKVTSDWGANEKFRGGDKHGGVDFAVPVNTPMASTVSGKVIHSGWTDGGFGNYVAIMDSNGNTHIFGHLNGVNVKKGQTVSKGDIVGSSGNTGQSTGPHLHYEVRRGGIGGTPINPHPWIG